MATRTASAATIPKEVIQLIKAAADITQEARRYTKLRRVAKTFIGRCFNHDDKTPSFTVWPDSGRWQCFGACGTGGDVIELVRFAEKVNFADAVGLLAERYGIATPTYAAEEIRRRAAAREAIRRPARALAQDAAFWYRGREKVLTTRHQDLLEVIFFLSELDPASTTEQDELWQLVERYAHATYEAANASAEQLLRMYLSSRERDPQGTRLLLELGRADIQHADSIAGHIIAWMAQHDPTVIETNCGGDPSRSAAA